VQGEPQDLGEALDVRALGHMDQEVAEKLFVGGRTARARLRFSTNAELVHHGLERGARARSLPPRLGAGRPGRLEPVRGPLSRGPLPDGCPTGSTCSRATSVRARGESDGDPRGQDEPARRCSNSSTQAWQFEEGSLLTRSGHCAPLCSTREWPTPKRQRTSRTSELSRGGSASRGCDSYQEAYRLARGAAVRPWARTDRPIVT
jgi:hypothetical protein